MPGGLDAWHSDCWEFARLQRAPLIAAARRRTDAVSDLSAYLLALRRDPDLPRLSLDGLAPVGSAILDRPEPCRVAHANSPCSSGQSASRAEGNDGEQGDSKHQAKRAERLPEPGRLAMARRFHHGEIAARSAAWAMLNVKATPADVAIRPTIRS